MTLQPESDNAYVTTCTCIRSNKKISVFRAMGLKILGRVGSIGTHNFYFIFFLEKRYNFMHFERQILKQF